MGNTGFFVFFLVFSGVWLLCIVHCAVPLSAHKQFLLFQFHFQIFMKPILHKNHMRILFVIEDTALVMAVVSL